MLIRMSLLFDRMASAIRVSCSGEAVEPTAVMATFRNPPDRMEGNSTRNAFRSSGARGRPRRSCPPRTCMVLITAGSMTAGRLVLWNRSAVGRGEMRIATTSPGCPAPSTRPTSAVTSVIRLPNCRRNSDSTRSSASARLLACVCSAAEMTERPSRTSARQLLP
ncbi:hypothetical protein D9M72_354920 [compost metagenome]